MAALLFGLETEYAIAGLSPDGDVGREEIVQHLVAGARRQLVHLPDMQSTGGVFLGNGSRFYVDCGLHPEICTPECSDPWDAVRYIQAGHRILFDLVSSVGSANWPRAEIMSFRCNVDYGGSHSTWGCHESYMHRVSQEALQPQIVPHLVTRQIYTGAGGFNPFSAGLEFTLSPRMAHFRRLVTESSTSGRGIWHEKSESLCAGFERLHVLCGESLCSETATFLKVGVTALLVAMADAGLAPGSAVQLADPLRALHSVAGDATCRKPLKMADGSSKTAIEIQRHYLEQAEAHAGMGAMPAWAADVCLRWRAVLDRLEDGPCAVEKTLDWGIKLALYASHARSLGIRWEELPLLNQVIGRVESAIDAGEEQDSAQCVEDAIWAGQPMGDKVASLEPLLRTRGLGWDDVRACLRGRRKLFEIDTRFGQLGPKGIFETLDHAGVLDHRVSGVDRIDRAMTEPPASGRARVRGRAIQRLAAAGNAQCDWQIVVDFEKQKSMDLSDPFAKEESWHPFRRSEARERPDSHSRRQNALSCYLGGDYARSEELLRGLLRERFEEPSTHCHLARVLLRTDRAQDARLEVTQAWDVRTHGPAYVVPRILFFQCVFAMLDGADIAGLVGQMGAALRTRGAHMEWTIGPLLEHLRPQLGDANYLFLRTLADALSDRNAMPQLDEFPQWRSAASAGEHAAETEDPPF